MRLVIVPCNFNLATNKERQIYYMQLTFCNTKDSLATDFAKAAAESGVHLKTQGTVFSFLDLSVALKPPEIVSSEE